MKSRYIWELYASNRYQQENSRDSWLASTSTVAHLFFPFPSYFCVFYCTSPVFNRFIFFDKSCQQLAFWRPKVNLRLRIIFSCVYYTAFYSPIQALHLLVQIQFNFYSFKQKCHFLLSHPTPIATSKILVFESKVHMTLITLTVWLAKMGKQEGENEPLIVKPDLNYVWYITFAPLRRSGKFWIKIDVANYV